MRSVVLILLLAVSPLLAAEPSTQIDTWIEKMSNAIREENYDGIFTYMRGHDFDTLRIIHSFEDGHETERLVRLNGEQREVIRHDDEVICRHAKGSSDDVNHGLPLGPFSRSFNENLAVLQDYYDFTLEGKDRVAGREAVKLRIIPKRVDRYGYVLWLDRETGLLLQSHLVYGPRVLEVFQFSRVEIGNRIPPEELVSSISGESVEHELTPQLVSGKPDRARWRVAWLPDGFRRVSVRQQGSDDEVFTDGIATFSIFVEQRVTRDERSELSTRMGGTVVISRPLQGSTQQITIVGELPLDTAKRVAESVEPVIY